MTKFITQTRTAVLVPMLFLQLGCCTVLYAQYAQHRVNDPGNTTHDHPVLQVAFGEFNVLGVSAKDKLLGNKIKDALAAGFLPVDQIEYIELTQTTQQQTLQQRTGQYSKDRDVVLRENDIRFYLTGTVTIYEGELNLEVVVRNVDEGATTSLSSGYTNSSQLYRVIDNISQQIIVHIIENGLTDHLVSVGLLCFEPEPGGGMSSELADFYSTDFPRSVYYNIETKGEVFVLPPDQTASDCDRTAGSGYDSLFDANKADLLVAGTFHSGRDREIVVTPRIYLNGLDHAVDLLPLSGDRGSYSEFEIELAKNVRKFIEGIIDSDGQLILEPFMDPSPTYLSYWEVAEKQFNRGNYYLAEFLFEKVVQLDSTQHPAYYNIGYARELDGDYEGAIEAYDRSLSIKPDYRIAKAGKAFVLSSLGNYDEAFELYRSIQQEDPEYGYIHYYLGKSLFYKDDLDQAVKELEYSARNEDPFYDTYYLLGRSYQKRGELEKSLEAFKKGLELKPDDNNAQWYIADIYKEQGIDRYSAQDYPGAYENLRMAKSYYEDEYIYDYLRASMNRLVLLDEADSLILEGIEKDILAERDIHYRQAADLRSIYFENSAEAPNEYLSSAISHLRRHLQLDPNDWQAYYMIGNSYTTLGNTRLALEYLEIAYQNNPVDNTIILDLSEILIIEGQLDKVHSTLNKLVLQGDGSDDEKSTELLSSYMKIVADKLKGNDTTEEEARLIDRLERGDKVYNWNYRTFLTWITEKARVRRKARNEIVALTSTMESHTDSN